jgi:copper chaperone CopZ
MEKAQFSVPTMWADHHVLKVRETLAALPGVQDVIASSAFRAVAVSYDPATLGREAIIEALSEAGYPVAPDGKAEAVSQAIPVADGKTDPAWSRLGIRITKTDARDARPAR